MTRLDALRRLVTLGDTLPPPRYTTPAPIAGRPYPLDQQQEDQPCPTSAASA